MLAGPLNVVKQLGGDVLCRTGPLMPYPSPQAPAERRNSLVTPLRPPNASLLKPWSSYV